MISEDEDENEEYSDSDTLLDEQDLVTLVSLLNIKELVIGK